MTYTPRLPLMQHQLEAITRCDAKPPVPCPEDTFAYLMDMGTGKSAVVLSEFGIGAETGGPRDLLVIAPKGSVRNWYREGDGELDKHCDPEFRERLIDCTWIGGGKVWENRMRLMMAAHKDKKRPRALFINVEALSTSEEALKLCLDFADQRGAMVVVDESTTIKGKSGRTQAVIKIGEVALAKRILSGLWTPRSPMDLYWQCRFLDERILGCRNFTTFRARYATVVMQQNWGTGRRYPQIVGYKNLEELQERVGRYSYRVLKKDCLDLKPKVYTSRDVELTDEQRRMLKEIKLFGHAAIPSSDGVERFVTTDMVIKRIMREIQIGCGYVMDDEERVLREVPERRTDALLEVLEEHDGKAIVWCPWRAPLAKIVARLTKEFGVASVAQWHGGNAKTRHEEEARFLTDPRCLFMCATQGAGMRGNTWVVADLVVYYANSYDLEHRDQSEDRAHRKGQTRSVTYVDLIAQGTIENKVVQALRRKIDLATMINREGHREWLI